MNINVIKTVWRRIRRPSPKTIKIFGRAPRQGGVQRQLEIANVKYAIKTLEKSIL